MELHAREPRHAVDGPLLHGDRRVVTLRLLGRFGAAVFLDESGIDPVERGLRLGRRGAPAFALPVPGVRLMSALVPKHRLW